MSVIIKIDKYIHCIHIFQKRQEFYVNLIKPSWEILNLLTVETHLGCVLCFLNGRETVYLDYKWDKLRQTGGVCIAETNTE